MDKDPRYTMSVTYGPNEEELLREIDQSSDDRGCTKDRNEVLRRGLHAWEHLSCIDEKSLMASLSETLKSLSGDLDRAALRYAEGMAFSILAIITAKYGLSKADAFQTIPMNLRMFRYILNEQGETKQITEGMKNHIAKLAGSIDTVFLAPMEKRDDPKG